MASILFVAFHFAPENTSGTHRSLHFARALVDAGHSVTVLTGPRPPESRSDASLERAFPWADRIHRVESAATLGSVYVKVKSLFHRRDTEEKPRQLGAPNVDARRDAGAFFRLREHVRAWDALPDHVSAWRRPAVRAGRVLARRVDADVVIASGPPWSGVMVGHRIAKSLNIPFIADFRDPWSTGTGETDRMPTNWAQRQVERWEATVLRESAVITFNSPRLARTATVLSNLGTRTRVIPNGSDAPRQKVAAQFSNAVPLRFRHFGSLYAGRSVVSLVRALDALIAERTIGEDDIELELIGDAESAQRNAELANTRVPIRFTPHLKFSEATKRMAEPCVLVCTQTEQHVNLIPTKLFDYLCTGNPIVVLSPEASASWDVASAFARSHRLDLHETERNRGVIADLVCAWRRCELRQVSGADTVHLAKEPLGGEFVRLVEQVVSAGRHGRT